MLQGLEKSTIEGRVICPGIWSKASRLCQPDFKKTVLFCLGTLAAAGMKQLAQSPLQYDAQMGQ